MSTTTRDPAVAELIRGAVATCGPLDTLRSVAERLTDDLVGVLVVGPTHAPLGIISERDLTRAMAESLDPDDARARDVMTEDIVSIRPTASAGEVARVMLADEIRHIAVRADDGELLGVVSIREILGALLG